MAKKAARKSKLRTFVFKDEDGVHVYQTTGTPVVKSRTVTEVDDVFVGGNLLYAVADFCDEIDKIPGIKELKENELKEITGISLA